MTANDDDTVLARVRESFDRQSFMATIGAEITAAAAGLVEVRLPYREDLCQQNGYLHGGIVGAVADVAGGYAAYSVFPDGSDVLTVEYKINMVAPAQGDWVRAVGQVIRAGRTLTICDFKVYGERADGDSRLCATGQQTLMRMDRRAG